MKRILLKISGESLSNDNSAIDPDKATQLAEMIQDIKNTGVELVIVLWWGNIYRWSKLIAAWVDPADSHNMSMLSTVFNAVTLKNFLEKIWEKVVIMDALHVEFLEKYSAIKARDYISEWKIVIASSGGGTPFFTTDTTGVLRALETHCDCMIKLTQVDGVYDSDPKSNPNAKKFETLSYNEFISWDLKVLDQTGVIMARDNWLPIYVVQLWNTQDVIDLTAGKNIGTKIS